MNTDLIQILLIEDNPGDARLIQEYLSESQMVQFSVEVVLRLDQGLKSLQEGAHDIVLLDLGLPDSSGIESFRLLHANAPCLPIIVLSGLTDQTVALEAVQTGAQDYLLKNQVSAPLLERAICYAIERKQNEERLQYLATHDSLTGLPNRALFQDRLSEAVKRARRSQYGKSTNWEMAIMLLDLNDFKSVNDTLGHDLGDVLLQAVAERLQTAIRQTDTVARLGGDEFTIIFENIGGQDDAEMLVRRIREVFKPPFPLDGQEWHISASVGVSLYPNDGEDTETLLKYADLAMYAAKRRGIGYCFYHDCKSDL